jgi:hypothetical protein
VEGSSEKGASRDFSCGSAGWNSRDRKKHHFYSILGQEVKQGVGDDFRRFCAMCLPKELSKGTLEEDHGPYTPPSKVSQFISKKLSPTMHKEIRGEFVDGAFTLDDAGVGEACEEVVPFAHVGMVFVKPGFLDMEADRLFRCLVEARTWARWIESNEVLGES